MSGPLVGMGLAGACRRLAFRSGPECHTGGDRNGRPAKMAGRKRDQCPAALGSGADHSLEPGRVTGDQPAIGGRYFIECDFTVDQAKGAGRTA